MVVLALGAIWTARISNTVSRGDPGGVNLWRKAALEAERFPQRGLRGLHRTCGSDHPDTLFAKHNLAGVLMKKGEYDVAEEMLLQVLVTRKSVYGRDHTHVLIADLMLGELYRKQQRWKGSEEIFMRGLKGFEKVHGVNGRHTLCMPVPQLGNLYVAQSRFVDAEKMYVRAMQGLKCAFGPDHQDTAHAMYNLGTFYLEQARFQDAEEMLLRALQQFETAYGPSHIETLRLAVFKLAFTYVEQEKMEEAERLYPRAVRGLERELGQSHGDTLAAKNNLGMVYRELKRFGEAEEMLTQAVKGYDIAYGPDHAETLGFAVYHICLTCLKQAKVEEAEALYQRLLQGRDKLSVEEQEAIDWFGDDIERLRQKNADVTLQDEAAIEQHLVDATALGLENIEIPNRAAEDTEPSSSSDTSIIPSASARCPEASSKATAMTTPPGRDNSTVLGKRKRPSMGE